MTKTTASQSILEHALEREAAKKTEAANQARRDLFQEDAWIAEIRSRLRAEFGPLMDSIPLGSIRRDRDPNGFGPETFTVELNNLHGERVKVNAIFTRGPGGRKPGEPEFGEMEFIKPSFWQNRPLTPLQVAAILADIA